MPPDQGDIAFLRLPFFKLQGDMGMRLISEPHNDKARRVHVETVNDTGGAMVAFHPCFQTISQIGRLAGYTQQAGGFFQHYYVLIEMDDRQDPLRWWGIDKGPWPGG